VGVPLSVWCSFAWSSNREEMLRHLHSFLVVPASSPKLLWAPKECPLSKSFLVSLSLSVFVRMCVRVCVCPVLLGTFTWERWLLAWSCLGFYRTNFYEIWYLFVFFFSENLPRMCKFHWSPTGATGTLHDPYSHLWSYLAKFLLEWEMF